jgi:hypothetical protein
MLNRNQLAHQAKLGFSFHALKEASGRKSQTPLPSPPLSLPMRSTG